MPGHLRPRGATSELEPGARGAKRRGNHITQQLQHVSDSDNRQIALQEYAARISSCLATHPWLLAIHPSLGVVGFAYASTYKPRAGYRWTAETSLYVSPQCQRKQVGSMLYKGLFSILVHLNIRSLFACIALPNEGSVGFHRRQGFEEAGLFRRAGFKQGRWVDCAWMQFQLPHEEDVGHQHQHHQESGCEGGTPPEPRLLAALTALELVALLALSSSSSSSSPSQEPAVHQQCSSERDDQ